MKNLDPFSLEARMARLEERVTDINERVQRVETYAGITGYSEGSLDSRLERLEDWIRDHT